MRGASPKSLRPVRVRAAAISSSESNASGAFALACSISLSAAGENAEALFADVYRVERGEGTAVGSVAAVAESIQPSPLLPDRWKIPAANLRQSAVEAFRPEEDSRRVFAIPFSERIGRTALVAGTFDTKGRELKFIRDRLKALGIPTRTVDLSTSDKPSTADVTPLQVASMHPGGTSATSVGVSIAATGMASTPGATSARAARLTVPTSPATKHPCTKPGASRYAFTMISGPMPAGSPSVTAMGR